MMKWLEAEGLMTEWVVKGGGEGSRDAGYVKG